MSSASGIEQFASNPISKQLIAAERRVVIKTGSRFRPAFDKLARFTKMVQVIVGNLVTPASTS
jgi:hypothetical protein